MSSEIGVTNANKRLYAVVLRLGVIRQGALPANHGDQARAALLALIREGDSPLAQRLHDDNSAKPYTISLLKGGRRGSDGAAHFGNGDTGELRFTLLIEPAFEALLRKYLLNRNTPHIRIGTLQFAVVDAFASGISHSDSGHISIEGLTDRWNALPNDLPREVTLDFRSPTAFNLGQNPETRQYRIRSNPDAKIIFSALRKRWMKLGGVDAGDNFDAWVSQNIDQTIVNLQTHQVYVERRRITGFTGQVRYHLSGTDTRWLSYLHLLADLAFWTGIGYQTTRGMGQVRKLN